MSIAPRGASSQRSKRAPPPSRREEARALFRNAILDAAEEVLAERGLHGARIQDIADRARMAVGTIYNYFGQKDDVLHALLEERTGELTASIAGAPGDPPLFLDRLEARLRRMFAHVDRHRGFFALALEHGLLTKASQETPHGRRHRNIEAFRAEFRRMVREGIDADVLQPVDPDLLANFLAAAIRAFVFHRSETASTTDERANAVLTLFLNGAVRVGDARERRDGSKSRA
jgi:AcrR family transcriptional regulator